MEKLENEDLEVVSGGTGESTYKIGDKISYHCNSCDKDVVGTVFSVDVGFCLVMCDSCSGVQRIDF